MSDQPERYDNVIFEGRWHRGGTASVRVSMCRACGAVVGDREKHDAFHAAAVSP